MNDLVKKQYSVKLLQADISDGIDTHTTSYFRLIWKDWVAAFFDDHKVCDPFARDCTLAAPYTNDINPNTKAKSHLDALEYVQTLPSEYFDTIIFDPPFSNIQAQRKYGEVSNIYTVPGYVNELMREFFRILKPDGIVLKFGYNSNRNHNCFDLVDLYLIQFGGNRNDVIVTILQKTQRSLLEWTGDLND